MFFVDDSLFDTESFVMTPSGWHIPGKAAKQLERKWEEMEKEREGISRATDCLAILIYSHHHRF